MATISDMEARANRNSTVAGLDLSDAQIRQILAQRLGLLQDNYGKNKTTKQETTSARGLGQSSIALKGQADLQQQYMQDRNSTQVGADQQMAGNAIKRAAADNLLNSILASNAASVAAQNPVTTLGSSAPTPTVSAPPAAVDPGNTQGILSNTPVPNSPFTSAKPVNMAKPKPLPPKPKAPAKVKPTAPVYVPLSSNKAKLS